MLTQERIPITGLLEGYEAALTKMGYSVTTKLLFVRRAELIVRRHQNQDTEYLDTEILNEYVREVDERYFNGDMKQRHYWRAKREIERFVYFAFTKKSTALPSPLLGVRQKLTPEFERISNAFLSGDFHPNTRCDVRWVTHKYFAWLEIEGFINLTDAGPVQIQRFLLDIAERYAPSTIHNTRLYLKKLYEFLFKRGYSACDYG